MRIGSVCPHADEQGGDIQLNCVPLSGRIKSDQPKAAEQSEPVVGREFFVVPPCNLTPLVRNGRHMHIQ